MIYRLHRLGVIEQFANSKNDANYSNNVTLLLESSDVNLLFSMRLSLNLKPIFISLRLSRCPQKLFDSQFFIFSNYATVEIELYSLYRFAFLEIFCVKRQKAI
jgi:hypothetical protein